jgi:hypothetical protein
MEERGRKRNVLRTYVRDTRLRGKELVGGHVEPAPCKDVLLRSRGLWPQCWQPPSPVRHRQTASATATDGGRESSRTRPKMLVLIGVEENRGLFSWQNFWRNATVSVSLLFDKYCLIMI